VGFALCDWVSAFRLCEGTDCEFAHNPKDAGGAFLQNFSNKFRSHTSRQPRRTSASTVTSW
jgi:hypothetical protein